METIHLDSMSEKEWSPSDVFDVFGDSLSRQILIMASEQPMAADDLAERLQVSEPTIYRRLNALIDYDLLRVDREVNTGGNDYKTVETTLRRVAFEIENGGYTIDLQMRQSIASQFESFWTDLDGSSPDQAGDAEAYLDSDPTEE